MEISFSNFSITASAMVPSNNRYNGDETLDPPPPRRTGSLIRPERIRIDAQHPQYHTRKRLANEDFYRPAGDRSAPARRSVIRRGLLGRDEDDEKHQQSSNHLAYMESPSNTVANSFDIWKTFCYVVTCCCPSPILKAMGKLQYITLGYLINLSITCFFCR
jgi:chitin synthase